MCAYINKNEILKRLLHLLSVLYYGVYEDGYRPDDGGSKHLWNIGKRLPGNTAQQPRRQPSSKCMEFKQIHFLALSTVLYVDIFVATELYM
jgi:hypothetical protein